MSAEECKDCCTECNKEETVEKKLDYLIELQRQTNAFLKSIAVSNQAIVTALNRLSGCVTGGWDETSIQYLQVRKV